jgi:hypothetical protein
MTGRPLEAIDGGRASDGWARLWASDRWPLRELPHSDLHSTVRAGSILFSGDLAAMVEGGSQAVGEGAASGRRGADDDGQLRAARGDPSAPGLPIVHPG